MKFKMAFLTLLTISFINLDAQAATKICSNKKSGAITLRPACKSNETNLSNLSLLTGATGPAGAIGPAGATGATGATGPAGSARGYGSVTSAGAIIAARSSANASASKLAGTGEYCITVTGVDSSTVFPTLTADFVDGLGNAHIVEYVSSTSDCTAGNQWKVRTYSFISGTFSSTDVAFSFLIP